MTNRSLLYPHFGSLPIRRFSRTQTRPPNLHALPNAGTGKGVPLQSVPYAQATHRNCPRPLSDRTPNQDLVPESTNEMEEGEQDEGRTGFGR